MSAKQIAVVEGPNGITLRRTRRGFDVLAGGAVSMRLTDREGQQIGEFLLGHLDEIRRYEIDAPRPIGDVLDGVLEGLGVYRYRRGFAVKYPSLPARTFATRTEAERHLRSIPYGEVFGAIYRRNHVGDWVHL